MTAWFSNFFSTGNVYCYHEAIKLCSSFDDLVDHFVGPYKYVGDSDSGLPLFWKEIVSQYPTTPIVLIERDRREVEESLIAAFPDTADSIKPVLDKTAVGMREIKKHSNCLVVPFEAIHDEIESIWTHCVPTIPFDSKRAHSLLHLDVQVPPAVQRTLITEGAQKMLTKVLQWP